MDDFTPLPLARLVRTTRKFDGSIILPDADDLNFMHWNINHLTNKLHLVEQYIASYPGILHVIVISETWLTPSNVSTYNLNGYHAVHSVRLNVKGGGISIFLHESVCGIAPKTLVDTVTPDLNHFLVIEVPSAHTVIAVPYRRPDSNEYNRRITTFLHELDQFCLHYPSCMLMGDFNLDQLDGCLHELLSDVLESNGFAMVNEISPRGVTRPCSGTILDICATNMLRLNHKLSLIQNHSSDHNILFASINLKIRTQASSKVKSRFDLSRAVGLVEQLCTDSSITSGNDLNQALQTVVNECTSAVTINSRHRIRKSHVNRNLILAIRERDRLAHLSNLYPDNDVICLQYVRAKQYVNTLNDRLKSAYETERLESAAGDARKTWKLYKEIVFNQFGSNTDSTITMHGIPLDGSVNSCNAVNDYFGTVGENLASSIIAIHGYSVDDIDSLYPEHANNNWAFQHVNAKTVADAINSLPNKKSTSFDKVPIQLLKSTLITISLTITTCFNAMIDSAEFPKELLKGRLKLIHKAGSFDIDNFRGLTILPSLSRVFEELLLRQLYSYLESLDLFVGNQFGFLKNSSCQGAALQFVDFIKSNYKKRFVAAMFIDLRKAFDTVDTNRLVRKFKRLGLSDSATELLQHYLLNRETATTLGDSTSRFRHINIGVPQGSKLGPLQFIVYINDLLGLNFIGQLVLYADDAAMIYATDTPEALQFAMQHDADLLHGWLCRNVLSINASKTCYMLFGRARNIAEVNVSINGSMIHRVTEYKYLGLVVDDGLTFHKHVNHVKKQITPFIALMWRKGKYIPVENRRQLYVSYVQSHLMYMLPIYGECAQYKLKELQTLQNRCIKAAFRLDRNTSTTYIYSTTIVPITELAKVERICLVYKLVKFRTKHNFRLHTNADVHGRSTRRDSMVHNFNMYSSMTTVSEATGAALMLAIDEFNRVDSETRRLTSFKSFRSKVKLKVMQESSVFAVVSPFLFVN